MAKQRKSTARRRKSTVRRRKSTPIKHNPLQNVVEKLNDSPPDRDRFFKNPSVFLRDEMGITLSRAQQEELKQIVDYLQSQSPAPRFYIPGMPPVPVQQLPEGAVGFV
ncbi:MAG: hypothetical protein M3270_05160 [Thermoproteota archaeon]|nr:hypothetical protein [Thermoproteota archaeon]